MQYVYFVIPGKTYASPDQKITFKLNNKNKKIDYIFIVDKQGTITNAYVAYNRVHLADYFKDQLPKK